MYALLNELHKDFLTEKSFSWSNSCRYDFFIPKFNIIIEMNGIQHYEQRFLKSDKSRTLEEEINNDEFKKAIAIKMINVGIEANRPKNAFAIVVAAKAIFPRSCLPLLSATFLGIKPNTQPMPTAPSTIDTDDTDIPEKAIIAKAATAVTIQIIFTIVSALLCVLFFVFVCVLFFQLPPMEAADSSTCEEFTTTCS